MIHYLQSENLKFKHTFSRKIIAAVPLFIFMFALFTQNRLQSKEHYFMEMVFNWWPLLFMTLGTALLCALSNAKERKSRGYDALLSHGISPVKLWLGKIIIVAVYLLLSSILLMMVMLAIGLLFPMTEIPLPEILKASAVIWGVSIGMIPVYLFLASQFGTAVCMGAGLIGMIAGVMLADKPSWIFVPWSWALRLMCPIVGVAPNGLPLVEHDVLRETSVIPTGLGISAAFLILACALTSCWFAKKEVR